MRRGSKREGEERREWPQGESRERSKEETDRKQVGIMKRSRTFPRSVMERRVDLSRSMNFVQTRAREFRVRVSAMEAKTFERRTSGRS